MENLKTATAIILIFFFVFVNGCGSSVNISDEDQNSANSYRKQSNYVPGELLVKFHHGTAAITASGLNRAIDAVTKKEFKNLRVHHIKFPENIPVEEAIEHYKQDINVEYAEPNYILHAAEVPDDKDYINLWGLNNTGQTGGTIDSDIDAPEAWDRTTGSHEIIIAVADSGLALNHPDFSDNIWTNTGEIICNDSIDNDRNGYIDDCYGWDFIGNDNDPTDYNGHGTHVSGIIAAQGNNGRGITGVMWDAQIMPLRMLGVSGNGTTADAISAILYANANNAHVINISWGGSGNSQALKDAIDASKAIIVCAAGNSGTDNDTSPFYPASYTSTNIISVTAADHNDALPPFSNLGATSVDLAAPGVNIYSTVPVLEYMDPVTVYSEDFDGASGNLPLLGWSRGGINSTWAVTGGTGTGGTNSLEDSPSGNYLNNTNSWARHMTPIALLKDNRYTLSFNWKGDLAHVFDFLYVNYSPDGINWDMTDFLSGSTNGNFVLYRSDFTSIADIVDSLYLGFSLSSDASATLDGVFIDDLELAREAVDINNYSYENNNGSSFAAPHVSGVAGLILANNPSLNNIQVKKIILSSVDPVSLLSDLTLTGGRLNAFNAVLYSVPPDTPSDLAATALSNSSILLRWADNSNNEKGFIIERKTDGGTFSEITTVGPNVTEHTDPGLTQATIYRYIIRAFNDAGSSSYSNEADATTQGNTSGGNGGGGCSIVAGPDTRSVDIIIMFIYVAAIMTAIRGRSNNSS